MTANQFRLAVLQLAEKLNIQFLLVVHDSYDGEKKMAGSPGALGRFGPFVVDKLSEEEKFGKRG